jgi:type II secretory pathway pseudopilin PulG
MSYPHFRSTAGQWLDRSGLSRVELLVLAGLLVIFAGVGLTLMSKWIEHARINRAVERARTINTLLSQYATDNNGVYPVGEGTSAAGKSEGIARNLLENNYTPDASVFAVGSTATYSGKAPDFSDISAANISWDFTGGATTSTGITSSAPDLLPTVYTTGEVVDYASAKGHGLILSPSGMGPFGHEGVVVAYKGGNALFIPAKPDRKEIPPAFILSNFKDTGTYTQIRP